MKLNNIKTTVITSALSLATLLGTSVVASAQRRDNTPKPPTPVYSQNQRTDWEKQQRIELEKQKQFELQKQRQYEAQIRLEQQRQEQLRIKYERNRSPWERNIRYKVYQNGRFFITDSQGLELLKQAVIRGYEEGFKAGLAARNKKRKNAFNTFGVYKKANVGFQKGVEMRQYPSFFQKGFAEGYQDGFNTRRFRGWFQNDGKLSEKELRYILKYERL